jgi:translation initiation factor 2-alpha kinase 4
MQMRMELLAQLWAAGISAELVPKEAPSLTEQYEFAHSSGARWLVILDDKTLGPNEVVRVKSL